MLNSENHFVIKHFFVGQYLWLDFVFCPKKKKIWNSKLPNNPIFMDLLISFSVAFPCYTGDFLRLFYYLGYKLKAVY